MIFEAISVRVAGCLRVTAMWERFLRKLAPLSRVWATHLTELHASYTFLCLRYDTSHQRSVHPPGWPLSAAAFPPHIIHATHLPKHTGVCSPVCQKRMHLSRGHNKCGIAEDNLLMKYFNALNLNLYDLHVAFECLEHLMDTIKELRISIKYETAWISSFTYFNFPSETGIANIDHCHGDL